MGNPAFEEINEAKAKMDFTDDQSDQRTFSRNLEGARSDRRRLLIDVRIRENTPC